MRRVLTFDYNANCFLFVYVGGGELNPYAPPEDSSNCGVGKIGSWYAGYCKKSDRAIKVKTEPTKDKGVAVRAVRH